MRRSRTATKSAPSQSNAKYDVVKAAITDGRYGIDIGFGDRDRLFQQDLDSVRGARLSTSFLAVTRRTSNRSSLEARANVPPP